MKTSPKTIYLGNFPLDGTEDDVRTLFAEYGEVVNVTLITDRESGNSRGFGFVEMPDAAATRAIDALDGVAYQEHTLRVNEARDRGARPPRRAW